MEGLYLTGLYGLFPYVEGDAVEGPVDCVSRQE